jgi:hypothetical protein
MTENLARSRDSRGTIMARTERIAIAASLLITLWAVPNPAPAASEPHVSPSKVEVIPGGKDKRVSLTEKAAKRIDIQTGRVDHDATGKKSVPYVAVFYDLTGESWVYTNPEPLSFVRRPVTIASVDGAVAHLTEGPAEGVKVVTVGVAELYGAERGIDH